MAKGTQITVLDGAGCIGGNKILLSTDGHNLMLDFGLNYGEFGRYFDGFMQPRSSRGLRDFLELGLVPDLDLYRPDLATCDIAPRLEGRLKLDAVYISHAHMDHMGLVGLIDERVPLLCGQTTAALVKGLKDSGNRGVGVECGYIVPREPKNKGMNVESDRKRAVGRDLYLPAKPSHAFTEFWGTLPNKKDLKVGEIATSDGLAMATEIFPVDHSVYGASAISIETAAGPIVYTGDLRLHGLGKELTDSFISKARALSPHALIVEGTRANREKDEDVSEEDVRGNCLAAVEEEKGFVLADFGPRNFERLDTFLDIAETTGRELVVTSSDAYFLRALEAADPHGRLEKVKGFVPLHDEKGSNKKVREENWVRGTTPQEIAASPGQYILCFSLTDLANLIDIQPKGGLYVYSNSEAFAEEQEFGFERLHGWLKRYGIGTAGLTMNKEGDRMVPEFHKGYHASGHASAGDLMDLVRRIDPEVVIPVHTTAPEAFQQLEGVRVMIPARGRPIEL
jgi:ribonuclease J